MFSIVKIFLKKRSIRNNWRKLNAHNTTQINSEIPAHLVKVGNGTYGMLNIHFFTELSGEGLTIGNYVSIASDVNFILGGNHQIDQITTYPLRSRLFHETFAGDCQSNGPIVIEDEVWIGYGATILSGVTIGKGAIIAACSVVTKNVEPYAIVGGNPAKFIRYRLPKNIIEKLQGVYLKDLDEKFIKENLSLFYGTLEEKNIDKIAQNLAKR